MTWESPNLYNVVAQFIPMLIKYLQQSVNERNWFTYKLGRGGKEVTSSRIGQNCPCDAEGVLQFRHWPIMSVSLEILFGIATLWLVLAHLPQVSSAKRAYKGDERGTPGLQKRVSRSCVIKGNQHSDPFLFDLTGTELPAYLRHVQFLRKWPTFSSQAERF